MTTSPKTHAIVIGASMSGLLAARALRDHFEQVTLLERDTLPQSESFRTGVPQARHVHALLAQGHSLIEGFFPGIMDRITERGAPRITWCQDTRYLTQGGWLKTFDSGIVTNVATRALLEWEVRQRLVAFENVVIRDHIEVDDLLFSADQRRVIGVNAHVRGGDAEVLHADLVVDTSGRRSKLPTWLTEHGYPAPDETAVLSYLGYATRRYRKPADSTVPPILFLLARAAQGLKRGGAIFEVEDGFWQVTLVGINEDYPPLDDAGFLEFARTLAAPDLYEAIKDAKPVGDFYGYRVDGSRWRHYESVSDRPAGLLVMGDSVCGFNPLYGQGMTVAAMEAQALGDLLRKMPASQHGFEGRFQVRAAQIVKGAWLLATGEDRRFPGTVGAKPDALTRFSQRYVDLMMATSMDDEVVIRAFLKVANLSAPALSLFAPRILGRVLAHAFSPRRPRQTSSASRWSENPPPPTPAPHSV